MSKVELVESNQKNSHEENIWHFVIDDVVWMSSDDWEIDDTARAIEKANGVCFVAGLGMGLVIEMLWKKPDVKKVVVVEKNLDVLSKVKKHLLLNKKITNQQFSETVFIFDDAMCIYRFPVDHFDYVYIDTYLEPDIVGYKEIKAVTENLKKHNKISEDTVIDGWMYPQILEQYDTSTTDI